MGYPKEITKTSCDLQALNRVIEDVKVYASLVTSTEDPEQNAIWGRMISQKLDGLINSVNAIRAQLPYHNRRRG